MYIYIYIYIYIQPAAAAGSIGWHYSSNATCLTLLVRLLYARSVASRSTIMCYILRKSRRKPALDK